MASPICTVNSASTVGGVNVTGSSTVTIALANVAGVTSWSLSCVGTDETNSATTINAGLSINYTTHTATFTAPAGASALIFRSQVNGGLDQNGQPQPSYTTTFGIYVLIGGMRKGAWDETTEGDAAFGWVSKFNALVENVGESANLKGTIQLAMGGSQSGASGNGPAGICVMQPSVDFPSATHATLYATLWCDQTGSAPNWAATTPYTAGQLVVNSAGAGGASVVYVCTTSGTSGGTAPTGFGTNIGDGGTSKWRSATATVTAYTWTSGGQTSIGSASTSYTVAGALAATAGDLEVTIDLTSALIPLASRTLIVVGIVGDPADTGGPYTRATTGGIQLRFS